VNTSYSYDSVSHLLSVLHQVGASTLDGASYTYDPAGNRTSKTNYLDGVTSNYGYDLLYQLTQVTQGGSTTESYSYDVVGNRLSSLGVATYSYNSSNELTSNSNGSYTYDSNGNTLTDAQSRSFTWDAENRLRQVVVPGDDGGTTTFKYDPFGRRVQKAGPLGTTNYLYDGHSDIGELDSSGSVVARYAQGPQIDEPLSEFRSGTTSFYEQDGVGSVSSLSSATGVLANNYVYDLFGKVTASSGTLINLFRYAGRELDSETGIYGYRMRYYDQNVGRFLSEDPIGFKGSGTNFYAYVYNNPINLVDPLGLAPGDKYPSAKCAGWNAENDYDPVSRRRNLEYGGFIYQNPDNTFSYTDPSANNNAGIGTADSIPNCWNIQIPAGTRRAGWYHTHAAFDPAMNGPGNPAPGQPGYNWHHDGNEVFSPDDKDISDVDLNGLPGALGTPRGTIEWYTPNPNNPRHGHTSVLSPGNCGCNH